MLAHTTRLDTLDWIPRNRMAGLRNLGLVTLGDLARHIPRRYEDRSNFAPFPQGECAIPICLYAVVAGVSQKRFGYHRSMCEVRVTGDPNAVFGGSLTCRWFNIPYMHKQFLVGRAVVLYGRPKMKGRQIVIDHPEYEFIESGDESLHLGRIVPVHPAGEGITPRMLRSLVAHALDECDLEGLRLLPAIECSPARDIYRELHFPTSYPACENAREELGLEESFVVQVAVQLRRQRWRGIQGISRLARGNLVERLIASFPFALTSAQEKTISEICADMAAPYRMNRLLQGDVGSGKTAVAMAAMAHCLDAGFPAVIMAPTQILAEQHTTTFRRIFEPLGIEVSLYTGGRSSATQLSQTAHGVDRFSRAQHLPPGIIIGTHALLFDNSLPVTAGLVVIDEQHKFGVLQRSKLLDIPGAPDALVMTATPIPRTLAQTLYGDLDVSILDEKPANRLEVRTASRPASKMPDVVEFLRKHIGNGRQAYIVYPLIEESEKLNAKAAEEEILRWRAALAPHEVGILHGRTAADEKEKTMQAFRSGKIAALVSTTVIEVGVDIPNATIMVIENSERFGLSQLHQLRGRIGRGEHRSFCILLHGKDVSDDALARLAVMERTSDGFKIAEEDLRIRGPGNVLGTVQAGFPPLKLADLSLDLRILDQASEIAKREIAKDPDLAAPHNQPLHDFVKGFLNRAAG